MSGLFLARSGNQNSPPQEVLLLILLLFLSVILSGAQRSRRTPTQFVPQFPPKVTSGLVAHVFHK
jgi:hypothetical protein